MSTDTIVDTYVPLGQGEPTPRPARKGAGRKPMPNPFLSDVRGLIDAVDDEGRPVAQSHLFTLNAERGETYAQRYSRIRRQLTAAGKVVASEHGRDHLYYIEMRIKPTGRADGEYTLTFWDRDAGRR